MRYLSCTLFAEGQSDIWFLTPVLSPQIEEIARIGGTFAFDGVVPADCRTVWEREHVRTAVAADLDDYDIVFVHNDHNERGKIDQLRAVLNLPQHARLVGVVPMRETEAWLDESVLPPTGSNIEKIDDPKAALKRILGRRTPEDVFQRLGATVSLERLRQLSARISGFLMT